MAALNRVGDPAASAAGVPAAERCRKCLLWVSCNVYSMSQTLNDSVMVPLRGSQFWKSLDLYVIALIWTPAETPRYWNVQGGVEAISVAIGCTAKQKKHF